MGMIYKRGRIWWLKYYRDGRPFFESSGSIQEAEARRLLKKREGEIAIGKRPGIYFDRIRFDDLAEDFLNDYEINGKSTNRAKHSIKHLKRAFGGLRVTVIDTPRVKAYIKMRSKEGAAAGTINLELAMFKRMLNLGAKQTPRKVDRVPYIPALKVNNVRKGFFEHGDFLALREVLPDHLKSFTTFAYKTGWRISEISNLQWSQVDREQGIVHLDPGETKNDEGRTVYLDDELKEIFRAQWEARRRLGTALPWVFLNFKGADRVKRFDTAWKTACEKAGIGFKLFHDLRRTAVRNMIRAGIPERVAMMISGHKTRSVFDRYNIVSDTDLKMAAQKQAAYLETQKVTKTVTIIPLPNSK